MPGHQSYRWDEIFDVVVVGSGGGALTAALLAADGGASVVVAEKSGFIGGTTAVSGGDMWIPNNRHIAGQDSREDAIAYVTRLSDGRACDPSLIDVYVDTAAEALEYLEAHTGYETEGRDGNPLPQMMMGLGPGSILVNKLGRRFMHGGYTYNDFSHPFGFYDQRYPGFANKPPAWAVFGARHFQKGIMGAKPGIEMSLVGPDGQQPPDWVALAGSVRELAEKIGVDADALAETVKRYNEHAGRGEDPDWADPGQAHVLTGPDTVHHKPVLGPPYGAIQQWPGTIGTNGGCRIDKDGRALGNRVPVIDGLYAAGNTSAAVLGGTYPGGGTCIGSSVAMGYRAGRHVAARAPRDIGGALPGHAPAQPAPASIAGGHDE